MVSSPFSISRGLPLLRSGVAGTFLNFLFIYIFFTIYSRYLKRVISKRDGREYLKQVPSIDGSLELICFRYSHPSMVLWSLSNEILWPHSVESSSYFSLIEQVSY
jgi:hypothetical protein